VYPARTLPFAGDEHAAPAGLLSHLDAVYGFALALTGDAEDAAELTEDVFATARDGLWTTLGGHGLRDRLLARCVSAFTETFSSRALPEPATTPHGSPLPTRLGVLLLQLPWDQRAALALVDQLRLTYASGAAVLGVDVDEFRAILHRGRSVLVAAYRTGAR
jgi:DNA-directed RNA polymerase specialized sigma24 family protein